MGNDALLEGAKLAANEDITLDVGNDLTIVAAKDTDNNKFNSFGLDIGLDRFGINASGEKDQSKTHENNQINAGNNLTVNVGGDADLEDVALTAEEKTIIDVKGDLSFKSTQNTAQSDGASFGFNVSASGFDVNGSLSDAERAYVDNIAKIQAGNGLDISVGGTTTLEAGLFQDNSGTGSFTTDELGVIDVANVDKSFDVGGSITVNASAGKGNGTTHEVAQINAGGDTTWTSGTFMQVEGDLTVDVGGDFNVVATTANSSNRSNSFGVDVGFDNFGVNVSGDSGSSTTNIINDVIVGGHTNVTVGGDAYVQGQTIESNTIEADIEGDLTFESLQNTSESSGASFGFNISSTGGGINGSVSNAEREYADQTAGFRSTNGQTVTVEGKTTLIGSVLEDESGNGKLTTGHLVKTDLENNDQSDSFGGSISGGASGVSNVSGHVEHVDKQGNTNASVIGVEVEITNDEQTEEEKATIIASLNTDADNIQETTKDVSFNASFDVNVENLSNFADNVEKSANLVKALSAPLPDHLQGGSPRAEELYRKSIANGATVEQATAMTQDASFEKLVKTYDQLDVFVVEKGGIQNIPNEVLELVAMGETILYGEASEFEGGAIMVPCPENNWDCQAALDKVIAMMDNNPNVLAQIIAEANNAVNAFLETGQDDSFDLGNGGKGRVTVAFQQLLFCVDTEGTPEMLATLYEKNPAAFVALAHNIMTSEHYNPTAIINATQAYAEDGDLQTFQLSVEASKYPPGAVVEAFVEIAGIAYELSPVADGVALVAAAGAADVTGVMIAGVGFVPIGKVGKYFGKGWDKLTSSEIAQKVGEFIADTSGAIKFKFGPTYRVVDDPNLEKILTSLYGKIKTGGNRVGNGGLADALRFEKAGGVIKSEVSHLQKAIEQRRRLKSYVRKADNQPPGSFPNTKRDIDFAKELIKDLDDAIGQ